MRTIRKVAALLMLGLLAGCVSMPRVFDSKGEQSLNAGIEEYNAGNYSSAAKSLQSALDQGLGTKDQVKARKYLAFTYCVSGKERQCRDEFRKALEIDPSFELAATEAGHPIWGPAFRSAKAAKGDGRK